MNKRIDLVGTGIMNLVKMNHEEYVGHYNNDTDNAKSIEDAINGAKEPYRMYKSVVQGLFNSGFLKLGESDFNVDQLFGYIYGVKCVEKLEWLLTLHQWLLDKGYTDHSDWDKKWNTSGDNYYSAYEFNVAKDSDPRVDDMLGKESEVRTQVWKVVIMENQSPTYAVALEMCEFTGKPRSMFLVRIKADYDSKDRTQEFLDIVASGKFEHNYTWSAYNSSDFGSLAMVDIEEMECKTVIQPKAIEMVLLNINSGYACIELEEE